MFIERLAIRRDEKIEYPRIAPYDPCENFEELSIITQDREKNFVFPMIRECLMDMRLDEEHIGSDEWSPFSDFITPGDTVVIKPNLVMNQEDIFLQNCTTTHPSIIRPIVEYTWKALKSNGRIIVGDAPTAEADFDKLIKSTGLYDMVCILQNRGINIELHDFRALKVISENGIWLGKQKKLFNEPTHQIVNLGKNSMFFIDGHQFDKVHGGGYDIKETVKHHHGERQEYCVSKAILNADVVISVPKLKTHRKAGITCCLKNLVGINCDKNYLPHFTMGSQNYGGDEMPFLTRRNAMQMHVYNFFRENFIGRYWKYVGRPGVMVLRFLNRKSLRENCENDVANNSKKIDLAKWLHTKLSGQAVAAGAWAGNATMVRMILDLNKIFLCCDKKGNYQTQTDRKVFYIVDGIDIGMGNGPTEATPLHLGVIAAGRNGFELDTTLLSILNIDFRCIPLYKKANMCDWIKPTGHTEKTYNGENLLTKNNFDIETIIPPDNWDFKVGAID